MKGIFSVPVVFKVKADSEEQAKEYLDRFMQRGFQKIEPDIRKPIRDHWTPSWAQIRGIK